MAMVNEPPRLLQRVRNAIRSRHYSFRTEQAYVSWIKRFIFFHGKRHPGEMGVGEVNAFLTHLAVDGKVSASTQNQALSALLFLYSVVLEQPLPPLQVVHAARPHRLPEVLSRVEVRSVLQRMNGVPLLVAALLYGTGMRLLECLQLRVKDLDFDRGEIVIRDGKGRRDRRTMLPGALREPLLRQLECARRIHGQDVAEGYGDVYLPDALARKYPAAGREWMWQYIFPASRRAVDPRSGLVRRHHLDESVVQKAVRAAAVAVGVRRRVSCKTFRHCFATHLLDDGYDIRTVQELLGHQDVATTMIYTHVLNRGARGVQSPLDRLERQPAEPDYTAAEPGVITARLQAGEWEVQSSESDTSVEPRDAPAR